MDTIGGAPRVVDGDTIEIAGERVRLHGIDAPEAQQRCGDMACGREATAALAAMIGSRQVTCDERGRDRYGRIIGVCRAGALELNRQMVETGWAVAYRRYSTDYVREEAVARDARAGIWAGEFVMPWDWRQGVR